MMKKNGQLTADDSRCSCGRKAVTVEEGVPLCKQCSEYYGEPKEAHLEPSE